MFSPQGKSSFNLDRISRLAERQPIVLLDPHGPLIRHWMERILKVVDRLHLPIAQAPFVLDHMAELGQLAEDIALDDLTPSSVVRCHECGVEYVPNFEPEQRGEDECLVAWCPKCHTPNRY